MSEEQVLQITDANSVRTLTLNRPDKLNAFSHELLSTLAKAVKAADKDKSVRCLVITGAGRAFCSGQDLAEVADRYTSDEPIELGGLLRSLYNPMIAKLRTMEKPVVCGVNGVAAGAGCSLALAADFRIAAESASFIQAFINVGLVPDSGSTFFLPRLIGAGRAMDMACTGRKVKADEALAIGLVNRVVPDGELASATNELAERLAHMPTRAIAQTKRLINGAWSADLDTQLEFEAQYQTAAGKSHDHREGVVAFLEKRKPQFRGE